MKYKNVGFRAFYHQFVSIPLTDDLRDLIKDFDGAKDCGYLLTYGYIDKEKGLTLEVLATGNLTKKGFYFNDGNNDTRAFIRIGAVKDLEAGYFEDKDGSLTKRYAKKIKNLEIYNPSKEVEQTREFVFLDESRDKTHIDDVLVYLIKDGLEIEGCYTRIIGLKDHSFIGILLNEPYQDFGYHKGDKIEFNVRENEDKKIICVFNIIKKGYSKEELKDGKILEKAVSISNKNNKLEQVLNVLDILLDSELWIPCNAKMSEEDQKRFEEFVLESKDDLDSLIGKNFVAHDETRLIPDILVNNDKYFFPIFSSQEAMGEYGEKFSKVQTTILEAIKLARNNDRDLEGIVLNAFSEPFVIDKHIYEIIEKVANLRKQ